MTEEERQAEEQRKAAETEKDSVEETDKEKSTEKDEAEDTRVPVAEVQAERRKRREIEQRNQQLQAELDAAKRSGLSESDRIKAERDAAVAKVTELEQTGKLQQRRALVEKAARNAKFIDPDDALTGLDLEQVEDGLDADRLVAELASRKPHLVTKTEKRQTANLQEVLKDGKPVDQDTGKSADEKSAGTGRIYTAAELAALSPEDVDANWPDVQASMARL